MEFTAQSCEVRDFSVDFREVLAGDDINRVAGAAALI
jgi:hypothetical protein